MFLYVLQCVTYCIAGAAAYFSVYGLAHTFDGMFWSVVIMGTTLEFGKLTAVTYLYRYWNITGIALRGYLITGIFGLMALTSIGIFGYLSAGYQTHVLPLKQKTEVVQSLEEERARIQTRKQQIDELLAGNGSTAIDLNNANAAKVLRESARYRDTIQRQFRTEQQAVNARLAAIDAEMLPLKQELLQSQAHIGPIIFIAEAFGLSAENATKYLILLIIFAFDPLAIALTLASNIVIRQQKEEKAALEREREAASIPPVVPAIVVPSQPPIEIEPIVESVDSVAETETIADVVVVEEPTPEPEPELEKVEEPPVPAVEPLQPKQSALGSFAQPMSSDQATAQELVSHLTFLKQRQANGIALTQPELHQMASIEHLLRNYGHTKLL